MNGRPLPWRPQFTLAALLQELGAAGVGIAVERNAHVVRRGEHAVILLEPGDRIEIVRLVGGG
ncbi:MAG: sulfur carrier protein ThiS [Planctomycetota bacterium]|nr:sulfur carrier protein ThiS [Planctomycetota bacterium]